MPLIQIRNSNTILELPDTVPRRVESGVEIVTLQDASAPASPLVLEEGEELAEVQFKVDGVQRWGIRLDAGSLLIRRHDEQGDYVDAVELSGNGGVTLPGQLVVASGGAAVVGGFAAGGDIDLTTADQVRLPTSSPLNTYTLSCQIKTIVSATAAVAYVAVPFQGAGEVMQIDVVPDAAIADGAFTVTPSIVNEGDIAGAVISMSALTAAGTRGSGAPDPAATVIAGDVLAFAVGGGNTAAGTATVTVTIRRAAITP